MGGSPKKKQDEQPQYIYQDPGPSQTALAANTAEQARLDEEERKKQNRRGRSSTLLTQDQGSPTTGTKTLLGS